MWKKAFTLWMMKEPTFQSAYIYYKIVCTGGLQYIMHLKRLLLIYKLFRKKAHMNGGRVDLVIFTKENLGADLRHFV